MFSAFIIKRFEFFFFGYISWVFLSFLSIPPLSRKKKYIDSSHLFPCHVSLSRCWESPFSFFCSPPRTSHPHYDLVLYVEWMEEGVYRWISIWWERRGGNGEFNGGFFLSVRQPFHPLENFYCFFFLSLCQLVLCIKEPSQPPRGGFFGLCYLRLFELA